MDAREPEKPRRRRPWLRRLGVLFLMLLVLFAGLIVWSRTEQALATVVRVLEGASGGRLELQGVGGTLYGPITVRRLALHEADSEVIVDALALDWSPQALLAATLRVDRLAADSVTVKPAAGGAAAAAHPVTLRVPLRVALQDVRIERVVVTGTTPFTLAPLAGSVTLGLIRHHAVLRDLGTPWARVNGELTVGAGAPFRLEGRASLRAIAKLPLDAAELTLSGDASRVAIAAAPSAKWFAGSGTIVLAPFATFPLQELSLALTDLDLMRLDPALPATRATLKAELADKDGVLSGPISVKNLLAGRYDVGRVPLSAASGLARFDGSRLWIDALSLSLGAGGDAGRATGGFELGPQGYRAALATEGVRLNDLHGALRPLRPAGTVRIVGDDKAQRVTAQLTEGALALALTAHREGERVELEAGTLRMPGGEITLSGRLLLNEARTFALSARLKDFDPGRFVDMPQARLTGTLDAKGALRPDWRAEVAYRIVDSRFAGAVLGGEGKLAVVPRRVVVQAATLTVGANRLRAEGRLGAVGDRLNVNLDAPALAQLGLGARGTLRANGWIGGSRENPAFALDAQGRGLAYRDLDAARLTMTARAPEGLQGKVSVRGEVRVARVAGRSLARLEATLEGTRGAHRLQLAVDDPAFAASARAQGGLSDGGGWDGRIEILKASRPFRAELAGPVTLRWRPGRLEAGAGRVTLAGGALNFEQTVMGRGTLASRGRFEGVALAALLPPPGPATAFETDLVVRGAWDIRAGDTLSGNVQLARERGDVVLTGDTPLPLKIGEMRLDAVARSNAIEGTLRGQGENLGRLEVDLRSKAEPQAGAWRIAPDAPLALRARFTIPSLSWLGRLLAPELRTGGSLSGRVAVDGTLRAPRLAGELNGEKLRVRYGSAGVRLRDGEMKVELAQDKVIFRRIAFAGDEGTLTASGEATLAGGHPLVDVTFRADKLAAVRRDDQQLVVSGSGRVRSRDGKLALEGEFTADRGLIELREEDAPRLGSDVVIVTQQPKMDAAPARLRIDMTLNLGDAFYVKGQGLDVRMAGSVRVTLEEGEIRPHARGSVRVVEGGYTAYGQQLAIARGVLLFDGPLDNPKLDILAVRKGLRVEAGVAITGTALSPRTALYSNPPVPDAQKMQWLVFGAGPGSAGDAEFGLSGRTQLNEQFVSVGAQLASAVYVSVGQSLRNADSFVQATVDLTERVAVQGRTGSENGVTLIYTWDFD
jgi:translocation and assembly module TamB